MAQQWTDEEREVIIYMRNETIVAIKTFYNNVLDGNEEAVDMFAKMIQDAENKYFNGDKIAMPENQQREFYDLIDKLRRGET